MQPSVDPKPAPHSGVAAAIFNQTDVRASMVPPTQVLSNGRYTVVLTAAGTGYSAIDGLAITRWIPDRTHDALGAFVYVRDEEDHKSWSVGLAPMVTEPVGYQARFDSGCAELTRLDAEIETRVSVCVAPHRNVELRRIT
ncbi:MAG: hypothetical protein M3Z05_22975, partial [Gemmatimonadota bacterium]|nr:hypothetical protein [Gemmatimonadota bacterium]